MKMTDSDVDSMDDEYELIKRSGTKVSEDEEFDPEVQLEKIEAGEAADLLAKDNAIRQYSIGAGHFSSNWIAAIDNFGKKLALHDMSSTEVITTKKRAKELKKKEGDLICEI